MAYGRLDVYWPDGRLESYALEELTHSVGRAEGNTISLATETISRYHFSITKDEDRVFITDLNSANGTFVDGVPIVSNEPRALGDVEEIQAGALRIIFYRTDDSPTHPMRLTDEDTARIEREAGQFQLDLNVNSIEVWPASSSAAELAITNASDETRTFGIQARGLPEGWLRLNRSEVVVEPDETAYVLVNIKPPRRPTTSPKLYQVQIEVAPIDSPEMGIQAALDVQVRAYHGFGIAILPQQHEGDTAHAFLHNQGSEPLSLLLHATDPQKALQFLLPEHPVQLQAGQRMRLEIQARAYNPPLTGAATSHSFILQAKSTDAAGFVAAAESKILIKPRFPTWALITVLGIFISVVMISALAILSLLNIPQPNIENVTVNRTEVEQGEPLTISWEAEDVETTIISVNQRLITEDALAGDTQSFTLDTSHYEGELLIDVIGQNRGQTVNSSTSAFVKVPMHVDFFSVEPSTLVRNVIGTLTIQWHVPGAETVRLEGLSEFTTQRLTGSEVYEASDMIQGIGGIPTEPLNITLVAEEADGDTLRETFTVNLIDPQCTAQSDAALFEMPNADGQQVGNVPQNGRVVVLAQDAGAGWLRMQLPGEIRGWGPRENFICDDTFNLSDLRTEFEVQVEPTQTATPVPQPPAEEANDVEITPDFQS